jgi:hypothetical protein
MITPQTNDWQEFDRLIDGACDCTLSADEWTRLGQWLIEYPEARVHYLACMDIHGTLAWQMMPSTRLSPAELRQYTQAEIDLLSTEDDRLPGASLPVPASPTLFSTTLYNAAVYFSSGWPVAYLIATVIFGIGMLVGAFTHVSQPEQIVVTHSIPGTPVDEPQVASVGRVTGMAACQWAGGVIPLLVNDAVPVGRKVKLDSGMMEITYNSGTKVILQGPVAYEVDSAAAGHLSLGKLTAKVDKRSGIGNKSPLIPHPSSLIPHPLFSVRTPTAVVTDLGTEFGIEVSRQGLSEVHVLQGAVDVRLSGMSGGTHRHQEVKQGFAVQIKPQGKELETAAFAPQRFARNLRLSDDSPAEAAYIRAVVADKPLGYWPLNEPAGVRWFLDQSGHGYHGSALNEVTAGRPGPWSGTSRALALDGKGYVDVGLHNEFALVNNFTVEAWVCMGRVATQPWGRIIAVNPNTAEHEPRMFGWALEASRDDRRGAKLPDTNICFCTYGAKDYRFAVPRDMLDEDRWLHVAVVCDPANVGHLYLNGEHRESIAADKPGNRGSPVWVEIGGAMYPEFWRGRLAHVAVYPRALTAEQIRNHYRQKEEPNGLHDK